MQVSTFIDFHFQNGKPVYYFQIVSCVRVNKNTQYFEDVGTLYFVCKDESVAVSCCCRRGLLIIHCKQTRILNLSPT